MKKLNVLVIAAIVAMPLFYAVACTYSRKMIANYKVTPQGYVVWRYSKPGEPKMDIMSNGDTLVTTADTMFFRRKQWR